MSCQEEPFNYSNILILQSRYNKHNINDFSYDPDKIFASLSKKDLLVIKDTLLKFVSLHPNYVGLLMKNMENFEIKKLFNITKEGDFQIYFNSKKCVIRYSNDISKYHELLHMASSYIDDDGGIIRIGFSYEDIIDNFVIGNGLTEGYTSVLEDRDLNDDNCLYIKDGNRLSYSSYWLANALARQLEVIIGKSKMEEYYFCADIEGVINDLQKYISRDSVFELLEAFDAAITTDCDNEYFNNKILDAQETMFYIVRTYFPERLNEIMKNKIYMKNFDYVLQKEEDEKLKFSLEEKPNILTRIKRKLSQ